MEKLPTLSPLLSGVANLILLGIPCPRAKIRWWNNHCTYLTDVGSLLQQVDTTQRSGLGGQGAECRRMQREAEAIAAGIALLLPSTEQCLSACNSGLSLSTESHLHFSNGENDRTIIKLDAKNASDLGRWRRVYGGSLFSRSLPH